MRTHCIVHKPRMPATRLWVIPLLLMGMLMAFQDKTPGEEGMQILTRGPIHEAFAQAGMTGATAGVVISRAPPEPIMELPPDQRPDGEDVAWIPGYWGWDEDRSDFIWVSGVWRVIPPNRQLVPGYWTPVQGGWQWISGFWADVAQKEITYLPAPPEPLQAGPSSPPPGQDYIWSPGSWVWQGAQYASNPGRTDPRYQPGYAVPRTQYAWQSGYWMVQRPDWIWIPAYYTWTPRGYVYVPGCWDYDIVHRGVIFAPVYYDSPIYRRPGYYYSPAIAINMAAIVVSLFVRPRSRDYFFGDYFDPRYEARGIYPWYSSQGARYGGDSLYLHYRAQQLRRDTNWDSYIDQHYRYRRDNIGARPPQTLALQINIINTQRANASPYNIIGRSLADTASSNTLPIRFTSINMDERKRIQTRGHEIQKFQEDRRGREARPPGPNRSDKSAETAQPVRLQLPTSPVADEPVARQRGTRTPPPMPSPRTEAAKLPERPQRVEAKTEAPAPVVRGRVQEPVVRGRAQEPVARERVREPVVRERAMEPASRGRASEPVTRERAMEPETKGRAPEPVAREHAIEPATRGRAQEPESKGRALEPETRGRTQRPIAQPNMETKSQAVKAAPEKAKPRQEASKQEIRPQRADAKDEPSRVEKSNVNKRDSVRGAVKVNASSNAKRSGAGRR